MLLAFLRLGVLTGSNGDDQVLSSYGIKARFTSKANSPRWSSRSRPASPSPAAICTAAPACSYGRRGMVERGRQ